MKTLDAEIFATGVWNGYTITSNMLLELANNFSRLASVVDVPLKLGHNDEQPMTDGHPALGWVTKVWVEGEKLFARFTDVPDIVYSAIQKKMYKNVSIEALFDVEHKGVRYGTVLTAVALLGVDMPAVNTLADLTTYMTANNLAFSSHATFSKKITDNNVGGSTMTPEEQKEFDRIKEENRKFSADNEELKGKVKTISEKLDQAAEQEKKATFAALTATVNADLESLVKNGQILPAQRDKMMNEFSAETADHIMFTIKFMKENKPADESKETGKHKPGSAGDDTLPADQRVAIQAKKFAAENKVAFSAAVNHILSTDQVLAREYADLNDQEA